jgi:uncharacterized phage protein (predicted DNA packaging)
MAIITLTEAKDHLRVQESDEDALISLYIEAAEAEIKNYINRDIPIVSGTSSKLPAPIKAAALLLVSDLFENRDGAADKIMNENPAIKRLLYPYRDRLGI